MTRAVRSEPSVMSLAELRHRRGQSQAQLAMAMGTNQSGVSRIERQPDVHVSTLASYVAALGGRLRVVAEFDDEPTELRVAAMDTVEVPPHREYRVIWQDEATRALVSVGWLQFTGDSYRFSYTDEARQHESFAPFPSFPDYDEVYRSKELFPFFAGRLVSAADPRFEVLLDALGLTRDEATPAELLSRAPTDSPHDTIQVVPEPIEDADGTLVRTFLVSGVRHAVERQRRKVTAVLDRVEAGQELAIVDEPDNPSNPRALSLVADQSVVGWIPDYLVDEVHGYLRAGRSVAVQVIRVNGEGTPWHLRLLCRMEAAAPPNRLGDVD